MVVQKRDEAIKAAFGQRVRELRAEKGLSQEALALACDLDQTYIGVVIVSGILLFRYANRAARLLRYCVAPVRLDRILSTKDLGLIHIN